MLMVSHFTGRCEFGGLCRFVFSLIGRGIGSLESGEVDGWIFLSLDGGRERILAPTGGNGRYLAKLWVML